MILDFIRPLDVIDCMSLELGKSSEILGLCRSCNAILDDRASQNASFKPT